MHGTACVAGQFRVQPNDECVVSLCNKHPILNASHWTRNPPIPPGPPASHSHIHTHTPSVDTNTTQQSIDVQRPDTHTEDTHEAHMHMRPARLQFHLRFHLRFPSFPPQIESNLATNDRVAPDCRRGCEVVATRSLMSTWF